HFYGLACNIRHIATVTIFRARNITLCSSFLWRMISDHTFPRGYLSRWIRCAFLNCANLKYNLFYPNLTYTSGLLQLQVVRSATKSAGYLLVTLPFFGPIPALWLLRLREVWDAGSVSLYVFLGLTYVSVAGELRLLIANSPLLFFLVCRSLREVKLSTKLTGTFLTLSILVSCAFLPLAHDAALINQPYYSY